MGWIVLGIIVLASMNQWNWWGWVIFSVIVFIMISGYILEEKERKTDKEKNDKYLTVKEEVEYDILTSGDMEAINILKIAQENPDNFISILSGGARKGNKTLKNTVNRLKQCLKEIEDM